MSAYFVPPFLYPWDLPQALDHHGEAGEMVKI